MALPIAFFIAKVVGRRWRRLLVAAVLVPLWASYLVKAFSWRAIIGSPGGVLDKTFGASPNYGEVGLVIVLAYLWLPYMIVPIYAGLERLPDSLLDASSDLGAHFGFTFRTVVLPLLFPSIVAGSVFTFSLSLGDYIAVDLVGGKTQVIGSVVFDNFSADLPFAAAFAVVPVIVMVAYILGIRRTRRIGEPLMQFTRRVRVLFGGMTGFVLAFLYLPLLIIAVLSFNTVSSLSWPPKGFTLRWWRAAMHSTGARDALLVSLKTAAGRHRDRARARPPGGARRAPVQVLRTGVA